MEKIKLDDIFDIIAPPLIRKIDIKRNNVDLLNDKNKYYPGIFSLNKSEQVVFSYEKDKKDISIVENYNNDKEINSKYFLLDGDILIYKGNLRLSKMMMFFYLKNDIFPNVEKEDLEKLEKKNNIIDEETKFILENRDKLLVSHNFIMLRLKNEIINSETNKIIKIFENNVDKIEFSQKLFKILKIVLDDNQNKLYTKNSLLKSVEIKLDFFKENKIENYIELIEESENEKKYLEKYLKYKNMYIKKILLGEVED